MLLIFVSVCLKEFANKPLSTVDIIVSRAFVRNLLAYWPLKIHFLAVKMSEVENGLDKCLSDLDTALDLFSVSHLSVPPDCAKNLLTFLFKLNANITIHHHQRETQDLVRSNTAATNDLLFQILTSQEEMKRIYQMQVNGEHAAERIMEAGQLVSSIIYAYPVLDLRVTSSNSVNCEKEEAKNISRSFFPIGR